MSAEQKPQPTECASPSTRGNRRRAPHEEGGVVGGAGHRVFPGQSVPWLVA